MTWSELALFWFADALTALYAFAVGATLGSFINVVVYRLPRGMSLARPGSRCPACGTPIRLRDNLPVVGWLRLHGRCRACGGAVSARYPLVEAAYGLLFATLLFVDVAWQPGLGEFGRGSYRGVLLTLWSLNAEQISLFAWHAWLFSLLGVVALLELDGQRIPQRITGLLLGAGLFAPLCLPHTRDAHFHNERWAAQVSVHFLPAANGVSATSPLLVALLDGFAGLAAGGAIGLALCGAIQRERANPRGAALALAASSLGLYYGWQTACGMWGAAAIIFLCSAIRRRSGPLQRWPTFVLTASALATAWARPWLSEAPWWPGPAGAQWTAALWASGAAACTLACGCIVRTWPPRAAQCETLPWQPVREIPAAVPSAACDPAAVLTEPAAAEAADPPPTEAPPRAAEGF